MSAIQILNPIVWVFAVVLICFVIFQSILFLRHALRFNKKHQVLTDKEVKDAMQTGAVSVIGPAFSILVISMSLIKLVGNAATFMRVGVIGSASYELNLANTAAEAVGVTLGSPEITVEILTLCLFGMILGSAPYFLNTIITLKPLDSAMKKGATKKITFTAFVGIAASCGLIGRNVLVQGVKGLPYLSALVASAISTILLRNIIKKTGFKSLNNWTLAIGLISGMIVGSITDGIIG